MVVSLCFNDPIIARPPFLYSFLFQFIVIVICPLFDLSSGLGFDILFNWLLRTIFPLKYDLTTGSCHLIQRCLLSTILVLLGHLDFLLGYPTVCLLVYYTHLATGGKSFPLNMIKNLQESSLTEILPNLTLNAAYRPYIECPPIRGDTARCSPRFIYKLQH